jgi:carbon monoxide dehydrogenase subunit G
MRFENRFDVAAPLEEVWATVLDVERVAPNVPGAQVLEQTGDDAYKVAIKVRVGPMSMTYKGDVEIVERDDTAHRAVMKARAKESRGQGTADADVTMVLDGDERRTSATVTTDVDLSGKVAAMGQGVLQDVSGRLVETFAKNLAAMLEGGVEPAAASDGAGNGGPRAAEPSTAGRPGAAGQAGESAPPAGAIGEGAEPARERTEPAGADALDLGSLGGAVMAERLRDPRRLAGLLAFVAVVAYWLGRRRGR